MTNADDRELVYPLDDGQSLRVRVLEPPLGDYADRIEYWWRDIREPLLAGKLMETSFDRFVIGEVNGVYAGSMNYCAHRDSREVALLEMVWTHPDYRRMGISRRLLQHTLADFRNIGGKAMYLCTTNPSAFALYASEGFRPLIGDGMRYLTPPFDSDTFESRYFADAGPARIRSAEWGDIARVSALYNQREPGWLIKDYPRRVFRDMRYESHYIRVWKPANEGRGTVLVLENSLHRIVGIASAIDTDSYYEQHVAVVDFWGCPAYLQQLPDLLTALIQQAEQHGTELLQASIAECDQEKRQMLEASGFIESARLRDRLRDGDQQFDLLIYERRLSPREQLGHPLASYYGARPAFQLNGDPAILTRGKDLRVVSDRSGR
jgi:GNAT superfamily N-acetyltransferase/L-amino acid N-acyltransferase YncA